MSDGEYPKGLGGGWWELEDGTKVQGEPEEDEAEDPLAGAVAIDNPNKLVLVCPEKGCPARVQWDGRATAPPDSREDARKSMKGHIEQTHGG